MYCNECGTEITEGENFCSNCGKTVEECTYVNTDTKQERWCVVLKNFYNKTETVFITTICVAVLAIMSLYMLAVMEEGEFMNPFSDLLPWFYILAILVSFFDFIPAFIAYNKNHINKVSILIVDFIFGWTLLGWVICLVWSIYKREKFKDTNSNKYNELEKLQRLKETGAITEIEFEQEKEKLLK